jgi:RNA polymerase sigma factor (sigma-70 family)
MPIPPENSKASDADGELDLRRISTQWSLIQDTNIFVLRYTEAARVYLINLLGNEDDAAEVLQSFLVRVLEKGWQKTTPDRGRFRFYLIRSIKNEAIDFVRRKNRRRTKEVFLDHDTLSIPEHSSDQEWDQHWKKAIVDRAMKSLQLHERENPGNYSYTSLQLSLERADAHSTELAAILSKKLSSPVSPEAFRKQLSRARRLFAERLLREVAETIESADPTAVLDEMNELGLLQFVRDYLPKAYQPS